MKSSEHRGRQGAGVQGAAGSDGALSGGPGYTGKANPAYLSSAVPNQRYDASLKLRQCS